MIAKQFTVHHLKFQKALRRQDKVKHEIQAFQDYHKLSFNEDNLHSFLFVTFALR